MKLSAVDLSVRYGRKLALEHVTLPMQQHRVTALIGPSGCGKSTFLRALNRMHELSQDVHVSGEVLLDGESILGAKVDAVDVRRRIGMVFQRPNPLPKSVRENVAFGLRLDRSFDRAKIDERVESALVQAALWSEVKDRLDSSALELSGGQQQRLCIARAIAVRPEVILMDEPASALDPIATARIEELILALREQYTVVIVTHSMTQAKRVSDEAAFFYMGALVESGPTAQLFESPRDKRTADYVQGRFG
jgi:phosphate transport system ATP-binding protein